MAASISSLLRAWRESEVLSSIDVTCEEHLAAVTEVLSDPLYQAYPPPLRRRRQFLTALQRKADDADSVLPDELADELAEVLCTPLGENGDTGWISFDSGDLLGQPIILRQVDQFSALSGRVWSAGACLAELFAYAPHLVAGAALLELGAGTGITGLTAALAGAAAVALTDVGDPRAQVGLRLSAEACTSWWEAHPRGSVGSEALPSACNISVEPLDWTTVSRATDVPASDIVLAADCCFAPDLAPALAATFRVALSRAPTPGARPVGLLASGKRTDSTYQTFLDAFDAAGVVLIPTSIAQLAALGCRLDGAAATTSLAAHHEPRHPPELLFAPERHLVRYHLLRLRQNP
jgi:predicted nicotinamide N-methyase